MKKLNPILSLLALAGLLFLCTIIDTQAQAPYEEYPDPGLFYNYAPSYIQVSSTERYMYVCRCRDEGQVRDHIMYRKATKSGNTWTWGPAQVAMAPSNNTSAWDYRHVCDPEVRKGEFKYNGTTYSWVMFYLGVNRNDEFQNQVGMAFANSPEGPWVKYSGNPIVTDPRTNRWGVGQPAATSVDGKGRLLLFVTRSGPNNIERYDININDMANPDFGIKKVLFKDGLTKRDGTQATQFQGAAFAYDPGTDRMYTIRGRHPFTDGSTPNFISTELEIAYTAGGNIWSNSGTWVPDGYINPSVSGKARNFDAGFLTDPYGALIGGANGYLASFAVSNTGGGFNWTYRMWGVGKSFLVPPSGPSSVITPGTYTLSPKHATGTRLTADGLVPSSNAEIFSANSQSNQRWKVTDVGNGYYELEPQSDLGKRLDVSGAGTAIRTNVAVWYQNGNNAQKWKFISAGNGAYYLEPKHAPGKRLDVAGAGTSNATNVWLWEINDGPAQQWTLASVTNARTSEVPQKGITNLEALPSGEQSGQITIYPNPVDAQQVTVRLPQAESGTLTVYDLSGKALFQQTFTDQQEIRLAKEKLGTGVVLLNLVTATRSSQHKVMIPE